MPRCPDADIYENPYVTQTAHANQTRTIGSSGVHADDFAGNVRGRNLARHASIQTLRRVIFSDEHRRRQRRKPRGADEVRRLAGASELHRRARSFRASLRGHHSGTRGGHEHCEERFPMVQKNTKV
jgi:hypothetical protein